MTKMCFKCSALCFLAEHTMHSSIISPQVSTCCQKGLVIQSSFPQQPLLLRHLLTSPDLARKLFQSSTRAYNNFLVMRCILVVWVSSGSGSFSFNSKMALTGTSTTSLLLCFLNLASICHICLYKSMKQTKVSKETSVQLKGHTWVLHYLKGSLSCYADVTITYSLLL